ncbi:DUF6452 family protein [Wenyingzhuangia sp. IMCC45533]
MKKTFVAILLILFSIGCQDEFCLDDTTPNLIIRFRDINTDTIKPITLNVGAINLDTLIRNTALDSLVIPINTQSNSVTYFLARVVNDSVQSSETITLNYDIEDVYVSKECGFKSTFKNVSISTTNNDWLLDAKSLTSNITNENNAHVEILH